MESMLIAADMDPVPIVNINIEDEVYDQIFNTESDLTMMILKDELIQTEVHDSKNITFYYSNTRNPMTLDEMEKQVDYRSRNLNFDLYKEVFLDIGPNYLRLILELNHLNNVAKTFFKDIMFHGPNLINGRRFGDVFNEWPQSMETPTVIYRDCYLVENSNKKLDIVRILEVDEQEYEFSLIGKIVYGYFLDSSLEQLVHFDDMIIEGGGIVLPFIEKHEVVINKTNMEYLELEEFLKKLGGRKTNITFMSKKSVVHDVRPFYYNPETKSYVKNPRDEVYKQFINGNSDYEYSPFSGDKKTYSKLYSSSDEDDNESDKNRSRRIHYYDKNGVNKYKESEHELNKYYTEESKADLSLD